MTLTTTRLVVLGKTLGEESLSHLSLDDVRVAAVLPFHVKERKPLRDRPTNPSSDHLLRSGTIGLGIDWTGGGGGSIDRGEGKY